MEVRRCTDPTDVYALVDLVKKELPEEHLDYEQYAQMLIGASNDPNVLMLGVFSDGTCIGGLIAVGPAVPYRHARIIQAVGPLAMGTTSKVYHEVVERWAKARGAEALVMETTRNVAAIKKKYGYEKTATLMTKELSDGRPSEA